VRVREGALTSAPKLLSNLFMVDSNVELEALLSQSRLSCRFLYGCLFYAHALISEVASSGVQLVRNKKKMDAQVWKLFKKEMLQNYAKNSLN
jgi:hypothetical protein